MKTLNGNTAFVECIYENDASNNGGNWNHLKFVQKIPDRHAGNARHQELQKTSHIGHCTHTAGSANIKLQNIQRGK